MLSQPSPDLKAKLLQIEEQLQLAMQEFPERIAIDRLKFALALAKFVRHQIDLDATVEQSSPGSVKVGRPTQQ
ncbi:MAG TPA: hypothetical protein VGJ74_15225 [Burkholderiales bacterium]|jgi:hypothetical protein